MKYIKNVFISVCVGLIFILGACNKAPQSFTLVETSGEQIKIHLDENFIFNECGKVTHKKYLYPTREWVEKKFAPYWFQYRNKHNLMYEVDATNCESFSFQSHFASQEMENVNIAFGVFFYMPDKNTGKIGHAINIIEVNDGDRVNIAFWQPQTSKFIQLSKEEIASCSFFYF
jgi:hypothetical protein